MPHSPHESDPLLPLLRHRGPLELDPARTVLMVVDLQYFDAHRDWGEGRTAALVGVSDRFEPYFQRIDAILPPTGMLLEAFRAQGAEVAHVRVAERTADARDVAPKQLLRGLIVPSTSKEAEFLEEVAPQGDELVFDKSSSGMFPATNVDRILRNLEATTLVFCGTSTGGCVESAVRDAVDLGYQVVVVEDACAASSEGEHRLALDRMSGPTCRIASAQEVADQLRRHPPRDRLQVAGTERVKAYLPDLEAPRPADADPYDLIFPAPKAVELDPRRSALLVLDAHLLCCDAQGPLLAAARQADPGADLAGLADRIDRALRGIAALIDAAHRSSLPVLHLRTASRTRHGRDLSPALRALGWGLHLDHPAQALHPDLPRHPDDLLLDKPGQGPFTGTGLDDLLRHQGIDRLVLCGVSTLGAVEAALRGATDRGYQVLLVPEACAARTGAGQAKLARMAAGLIETASLDEALGRLQGVAAPA